MANNNGDDDRGALLPLPYQTDSAYRPLAPFGPADRFQPQTGGLAEKTISDVLGWRFREGDTTGFVAALTGSFELREVEGHTEAIYTPRGYAIQADLGAVTGGQASIAARARTGIKDSLALLDSLRPLKTDSDPEDSAGFRALVRYELEQIGTELASTRIRIPRVDQLFVLMLGSDPGDADAVEGHLGELRDALGLKSDQVNTIEEEKVQTSFITLVDWVVSLYRGWTAARDRIDPFAVVDGDTPQPFFGPLVVALSQLLSAVSGQVEELWLVLDSVGISESDRDVLRVPPLREGEPSLSLGGLLRWVNEFATQEGRKLIEVAGKDGVDSAFVNVVRTLRLYVAALPKQSWNNEPPPDNTDESTNYRAILPPGFFSSRVQRAIDELDDLLQETDRIATRIKHGKATGDSQKSIR